MGEISHFEVSSCAVSRSQDAANLPEAKICVKDNIFAKAALIRV
jgi:hypothetical protein